ncbi:hypothetical protein ACWCWE_38000, partial [Streptomyces sp. NPDC001759]
MREALVEAGVRADLEQSGVDGPVRFGQHRRQLGARGPVPDQLAAAYALSIKPVRKWTDVMFFFLSTKFLPAIAA